MKSRRFYVAVVPIAVASLLVFSGAARADVQNNAPTGVRASASNLSVSVGWHVPTVGTAPTSYNVYTDGVGTPKNVAAPLTRTTITLPNGTPHFFTVTAVNGAGEGPASANSNTVTPNDSSSCQFDSFPAVPGGTSELAVGCTLDTAAGGLGSNYKIEDYPQAQWHSGAGRSITTSKTTPTATKIVYASSALAHFTPHDINDAVSGVGVPSNTFIIAEAAGTATTPGTITLNQAIPSPGLPVGRALTIDNSDGRTFTDTIYPASTVAAASNGIDVTTFNGTQNLTLAANAHFPTTGGTLKVATSDPAGAQVTYTGISGTTVLTHVTYVPSSGIGTLATGGAVSDPTALYSATAHFCRATPALTGCPASPNSHNDVGRTLSGTRVPHGTTVTAVNSLTSITISQPTVACPSMVPAPLPPATATTICAQVSLSGTPGLTTLREVTDATYTSPNKVCSVTAGFGPTDVNLPISNVGTSKIGAGNYITAVAGTCATLKNNYSAAAAANPIVVVGTHNSGAPLNGDAVMSLSSELSVAPQEAAGEPSCDFGSAVGSNLVGKWENPGAFVTTGGVLGAPTAAHGGPIIAQLVINAGAGNAFAGYVVKAGNNTSGDLDLGQHYDIDFPQLLTGIAVCPEPNDVGVATNFRFFGETLSQSASQNGDVREFEDLAANTPSAGGTAYEHILQGATAVTDSSGSCTISYPTSAASFSCGGN